MTSGHLGMHQDMTEEEFLQVQWDLGILLCCKLSHVKVMNQLDFYPVWSLALDSHWIVTRTCGPPETPAYAY